MTKFGDTDPVTAIRRLCERTEAVASAVERVDGPATLAGRVLAEPVAMDRDSPACDVSAMDGYAVRHAELADGRLPVVGECRIGQPPLELPPGVATRIYTGSPVPTGADAVARLEWVAESDGGVALRPERDVRPGQDIRRKGENLAQGEPATPRGVELTAAAVAALASIGPVSVSLHRKLRVAILTTGDEVVGHREAAGLGAGFPAWRLRNSNGPALQTLVAGLSFVGSVEHRHVVDDPEQLAARLRAAVAEADVVVLTGGVSKGGYDFGRAAVERAGGEVLFHGVTARPGRPTLGAVAGGAAVLGLPGNPVAVLTTGRRLLVPVLRHRAGVTRFDPPAPLVTLDAWGGKTLPLTWWRPATLADNGRAVLASLRGSGDVCGPAATDGFVEAPPGADHAGPYPFYSWRT